MASKNRTVKGRNAREEETRQLLREGRTIEEIAEYYNIGVESVKAYLRQMGCYEYARKIEKTYPTIEQIQKANEEHTCSRPVPYVYKGKMWSDITQDFTDRGNEYKNQ